jgi:hypothetical protein
MSTSALFKDIDVNKGGTLDIWEFKSSLKEYHIFLSDHEMELLWPSICACDETEITRIEFAKFLGTDHTWSFALVKDRVMRALRKNPNYEKVFTQTSESVDISGMWQVHPMPSDEGGWIDGQKHGKGRKGTCRWADGSFYKGQWEHGLMHGQGVLDYEDGSNYEGCWFDGKRHGQGGITLPDGSSYIGQWEHGSMHGWGLMVYYSSEGGKGKGGKGKGRGKDGEGGKGKAKGKGKGKGKEDKGKGKGGKGSKGGKGKGGEWAYSKRDGQGKMALGNTFYEGGWVDGKEHGQGKSTFADHMQQAVAAALAALPLRSGDGKLLYTGQWEHGMRHGHGVCFFNDGSTHEGDWVRGKLEGHGKETHANDGTFEGRFVAGLRHGKGVEILADGAKYKYETDWVHGKMQEWPAVTLANGSTLPGMARSHKQQRQLGEFLRTQLTRYLKRTNAVGKTIVQLPPINCPEPAAQPGTPTQQDELVPSKMEVVDLRKELKLRGLVDSGIEGPVPLSRSFALLQYRVMRALRKNPNYEKVFTQTSESVNISGMWQVLCDRGLDDFGLKAELVERLEECITRSTLRKLGERVDQEAQNAKKIEQKNRRKKKKRGGGGHRRLLCAAQTCQTSKRGPSTNVDEADPIELLAQEKAKVLEHARRQDERAMQQAAAATLAATSAATYASSVASARALQACHTVLPLVRQTEAAAKRRDEAALEASVEAAKMRREAVEREKGEMKEARLKEQAKLARNKACKEREHITKRRAQRLMAGESAFAQIMREQEEERVQGKVRQEEDQELEVMQKEVAIAWEVLSKERDQRKKPGTCQRKKRL